MSPSDTDRPLISLVIPVYNVGDYLPDFLDSVSGQEGGLLDIELIFVNDGSRDHSEELIRNALPSLGDGARLISTDNRGPSRARNTGLELATGRWVSFPDPDDILDTGYLRAVREFLDTSDDGRDVPMIVVRNIEFSADVNRASDVHPLRYRFQRGTRVYDLSNTPRNIHMSVNMAFFRLATIRAESLEFHPEYRNFEDASFVARYLFCFSSPRIAVLPEALYLYRRRLDGSSLIQSGFREPSKYDSVLRLGHLGILKGGRARYGFVPVWVQYMVLYDLQWYFKTERSHVSATAGLAEATAQTFNHLVDEILTYMDSTTFLRFNITSIPMDIRLTWWALKNQSVPPGLDTHFYELDTKRQLAQIRLYSANPSESETIYLDGLKSEAAYAKTRALVFFGRSALYERILWVPASKELSIVMPGSTAPDRLRFAALGEPVYESTPQLVYARRGRGRAFAAPGSPRTTGKSQSGLLPRVSRFVARVRRTASRVSGNVALSVEAKVTSTKRQQREFRDAWMLIDRDTTARDNAESLYRHLMTHRRDINAWFIINRSSRDFSRLKKEGFKVVAHGSRRHLALARNANHLISSQIDHYIVRPFDSVRLPRPGWQFTFLQHGVTHNDMSRWLNSKKIDLFITSSSAEYDEIAGDNSPYLLTQKEVSLTGMPRHDELLEKSRSLDKADRRLILIMPTWRQSLLSPPSGTGNSRSLRPDFWQSEYAMSWFGLLNNSQLADFAAQHNLEVVFAPHPNLQGLIPRGVVPRHIRLIDYADHDIKDVIAAACVSVTDYSSLAFESAYIDVPVVYFQFDQETFYDGSQPYRKAAFRHAENGFGPVATDVPTAVSEIIRMVTEPEAFVDEFASRIEAVFRQRDGKSSERVTEAILQLEMPDPSNH